MFKKYYILLIACILISCNSFKEKIANYYISKAEKIIKKQEISIQEIDSIYEYLSKSLDYKKDLHKTIEISDKVFQTSFKNGYQKAYELHSNLISKYLKLNPYSWEIHLNLISFYSLKGDIRNLDFLINEFENLQAKENDEKNKFSFILLKAIVYTNLIAWIESQGYLSTNINSDHTIEYLKQYKSYLDKFLNLKKFIENQNNDLFKNIDKQLKESYEIFTNEIFKNENEIRRNIWIYEKNNSDPNFSKALKYTLEGNTYLVKKEYTNAKILYKAATNNYENFINAKKQMIETNFQQSMSLALTQNKSENLIQNFYEYYEDINYLIDESQHTFSLIPFISNEKFLSDVYALKAAIISGLLTLENFPQKSRSKIKTEFEQALNKAIELNPNNKLARDLFVRQENKN